VNFLGVTFFASGAGSAPPLSACAFFACAGDTSASCGTACSDPAKGRFIGLFEPWNASRPDACTTEDVHAAEVLGAVEGLANAAAARYAFPAALS
jgi:hypothetical protein